jgi:hypothetical protein
MTKGSFGWDYQVKSVSHPTESANCTSSYATGSKEIVDMEIGMCQGAEQSDTTAEGCWSWLRRGVLSKL